MPVLQRIEHGLLNPVRAHQLAHVKHDVSLFRWQGQRLAFCAQQVDHQFTQTHTTGNVDLRGPNVVGVALAHRGQDGDLAQLWVDNADFAREWHHRKQALSQFRAVQQHAERTTYASEYPRDLVKYILVFWLHLS